MALSTVPRKRRRFAFAGIPLIVGLFASVVATAPWAPAQSGGPDSFGYRFIDSKGAGGPAGGATTIVGNGGADIGNHCDNCVTPLTLPFPVDFYDQAGVTNVNVNSNGVLEFDGNSNDWHASKLPAAPFGHAALGYWKDLNTENAVAGSNPLSGIYTRTDGVAPNRTFTVEWNAALQGALATAVDFQMVFTEGSADFVNQYIKTPGGTGAAIGIQRQFGPPGKFLQYSYNTASVPNGTAIRWTPGPSLVLGDMAIAEGDSPSTRTAPFVVRLQKASPRPVTFHWTTVNNTANAALGDFVAVPDTVATIPAGQTSLTLPVTVNGDNDVEGPEQFLVQISQPDGAFVTRSLGHGMVHDDDPVVDGPLVSVGDVQVSEGDSGTGSALFPLTLSSPLPYQVSVFYSTIDGPAVSPTDFTGTAGKSILIPANQTSVNIVIPIKPDQLFEGDEGFTVHLFNAVTPFDSSVKLGKIDGSGNIFDDDPAPKLAVGDVSVVEGDIGQKTAVFTVTLSRPHPVPVTFHYMTVDGTASAAAGDYVAKPDTVGTIAAGKTSTTISVTLSGDTETEVNEAFTVKISAQDPAAINLTRATGTGTILNDDLN